MFSIEKLVEGKWVLIPGRYRQERDAKKAQKDLAARGIETRIVPATRREW